MRWKPGPRPLSIRVFAAAFLAAACVRLVQGLSDLATTRIALARYHPELAVSDDRAIVLLSAECTIALIPIVWIYGFAAPFARWLVLGFGAIKLTGFAYAVYLWITVPYAIGPSYAAPVLTLIALAALLTSGAGRWLAKQEERHAAVFE